MKFTAQFDADRRNLTPSFFKNTISIYTNLTQKYVIQNHVISMTDLHSFIECVLCQKYVESSNAILVGGYDVVFGLPSVITWRCM